MDSYAENEIEKVRYSLLQISPFTSAVNIAGIAC